MREDTRRWIEADQAHCWHPFTRQADWCARGHEPLVLVRGEGSWLWDSEGWRYLNGIPNLKGTLRHKLIPVSHALKFHCLQSPANSHNFEIGRSPQFYL